MLCWRIQHLYRGAVPAFAVVGRERGGLGQDTVRHLLSWWPLMSICPSLPMGVQPEILGAATCRNRASLP